jgi:hypothetical protein
MSVAKSYTQLKDYANAEKYLLEAVHIFEVTSGDDSPLTGNACKVLGELYWTRPKPDRMLARKYLKQAYHCEAIKDHVEIMALMEVHNMLIDTHIKGASGIDRNEFKQYKTIVELAYANVKRSLAQDGNAAVYYKLAGEMYLWMGVGEVNITLSL